MIRDFIKEISEKSAPSITKFLQSKMLELTEEEIKYLDKIREEKRRIANERQKLLKKGYREKWLKTKRELYAYIKSMPTAQELKAAFLKYGNELKSFPNHIKAIKNKIAKMTKAEREAKIRDIQAMKPQNEYEAMRNKYLIEYLKNNDITNINEAEGIMIREDDNVIEVFISDCDDELVTDGTRLG
jgi:hypothetical protein